MENQLPEQPETNNGFNNKTSCGLDANVAGLLCYVFGFVTGIIFLLIEKENKFVRFHAMQSIFVFVALLVANVAVDFLPFIGGLLSKVISLGGFVLWVLLMIKAFNKELFKLPIVGDMAEKQINS